MTTDSAQQPPLEWDWDSEHEDRKAEAKADAAIHGATPFQVDRKLLKDIVHERMGAHVARIKFLGAGTFHKGMAKPVYCLLRVEEPCTSVEKTPLRNGSASLPTASQANSHHRRMSVVLGDLQRRSWLARTHVRVPWSGGIANPRHDDWCAGYLVTLVDRREVVARVARRFMPRLKTESEVATMRYLRQHSKIPVPEVYHYDSNPYNRLGGEYILMSKAPGIPLAKVFHSMPHNQLVSLVENIARLIIPLFGHRFPMIGSLYDGPDPNAQPDISSSLPTPTPSTYQRFTNISDALDRLQVQSEAEARETHVGPIVSWPFFGSNRGELSHPDEINRGPWRSTHDYLLACTEREIRGVILENEGKAAPHRLHLDPDEIETSRHHKVTALPDDRSDASDEWDWEESEAEWEGPGDTMYQDYRRMQRTTFLVAHLSQREERVKQEMDRFLRLMERLGVVAHTEGDGGGGSSEPEEFSLDCHDLNLENVFVDEHDNSKITCIIDWESTTTRPLWACAHVPAFLQSSPFTAKLFRATVEKLARGSPLSAPAPAISAPTLQPAAAATTRSTPLDLPAAAAAWLHHETTGARLRMAHRCIEWDGWEEGLVESMLGPADEEEDWFREWRDEDAPVSHDEQQQHPGYGQDRDGDTSWDGDASTETESDAKPDSPVASISPTLLTVGLADSPDRDRRAGLLYANTNTNTNTNIGMNGVAEKGAGAPVPKVVVAVEKEREKLLNATGDICGGRGGELGRRLEAWLYVNGDADGRVDLGRRWHGDGDGED
ncbi:hypothetical protein C8Q80DRAFT_1121584 [Daedaleopsis nitida]|nr:hypothetical protein C8Q80DRAFT_1121584 [Daedaleopsis nitida]